MFSEKERNYYKAIGLVTTQEEFDAYQVDSQFVSYHSRPAERVDLNSTTMYKVRSFIILISVIKCVISSCMLFVHAST